jgi:hypothetical protein
MILLHPVIFFLAFSGALTLDQVRADPNPEHRAKAAMDYAEVAERAAEFANDANDQTRLAADIGSMVVAMELARDSFIAAGKTPSRQPGSFKNVELRSHEMLIRLTDLRQKMDAEQKSVLDGPIMKIQAIHDAWFDGIMGKKK